MDHFSSSEIALQTLPPFTAVLGRVSIAAVVLLTIARARGARLPVSGTIVRRYLLLGLISNALPFSLIVWGQTQIPSGLASIINAMTPIWAVLVGLLIGSDERLTGAKAIGVLLGFTGVAVLIGPDLLRQLDPYSLGQLSVLARHHLLWLCRALRSALWRHTTVGQCCLYAHGRHRLADTGCGVR